ncbi:hypothetical protein A3781_19210 [Bacillus badius]|nr:hypothetical protein A3781_19210 [Bacillus badius]
MKKIVNRLWDKLVELDKKYDMQIDFAFASFFYFMTFSAFIRGATTWFYFSFILGTLNLVSLTLNYVSGVRLRKNHNKK